MKLGMKVGLAALALSIAAVQFVGAAPATWTGKISDAMCGVEKHQGDGTMAGDHDCVAKCVKGGSTYIFVNAADKKVYKIGNQDFAALVQHAGHTVTLTGELKNDTITVTKIAMPPAK